MDVQRLQAMAGNAAVTEMLRSSRGRAAAPLQRERDGACAGPGACGCASCSAVDDPLLRDEDKSAPVVARVVDKPAPVTNLVAVSRVAEPAPPTQGEAASLIGLTHNDGMDVSGKPLRRGDKTKLRPTPSTDDKLGVLGEFPVNTQVLVDRKIATWYHVVVASTGQTGYMAADLVATDLPDPKSTFHRIGTGEGAFQIIKDHYKVDPDDKFHNLRFYANGLVEVNSKRGRHGIYEPSSEEKKRLQIDSYARTGHLTFVDAATVANAQIVLPSKDFVETLDVSSGSWVRDVAHTVGGWLEKAVEFVAFPAGLIVGALQCLWDTISGIVEMVWKLLKAIVTGSLIDDLRELGDSMVKLFTDQQTRQVALEALADWLESRWNNPNSIKRWYWRGWIIGYLTAEVILTFFSGGEALLEGAAAQIANLSRVIKATQFGAKAVAAIEGAVAAVKGSKAAIAIKDAAEAVKGSRAVKAVKGTVEAAKASKIGKTVGVVVEVSAAALAKARKFAADVLGFPAKLIARISDEALIALEKLSPEAAQMIRKLNPDRLLAFLGCRSPCTISPANLAERLLRVERAAAGDAEAAAAAVKRAQRAAARADAASTEAAEAARKAKNAAAAAKGRQAAARAEKARDAAADAKTAAEKAKTATKAVEEAKKAEKLAAEAHEAAKAHRAQNLKRSAELGELRRYKVQEAADTLDDAGRKELTALIDKLERGEITADEAKLQRQALIARARARRGAYEPAVVKPEQTHGVSKATGKKMDAIEAERQKLIDKRVAVNAKLEALAKELGADVDDIKGSVEKLVQQGNKAGARRLAKLEAEYKQLGLQLVRQSEGLGMVAVRDFAASKGARPLYEGPPGTPGTLDAAFHKPGPPVTLFVCEAKGGGSGLTTRMIKGTAYEQGSPEYLLWMLENDKGFRAAAEKAGLLKLIETGEIKVEYHLVRAPGGQEVLINEFDITPRRRP